VLFVRAGYVEGKSGLTDPSKGLPVHPGLAYVAASARMAGHEVAVLDAMARRMSVADVVSRAGEYGPDVLAFPAYTPEICATGATAAAIRGSLPDTVLMVGGCHPSPLPERTLEEFPAFDAVVVGEGEQAFVELLERLDEPDSWKEIPGLCVRRGGAIEKGPERPAIADLDSLAFPAFDLFNGNGGRALYASRKAERLLTLGTARGCPYRCLFCQNPMGRRYRIRSVESVIEEIDHDIKAFNVQRLLITDETFTLSRRRTELLLEGMLGRGFGRKIAWSCITRADALDPALLRVMRAAGCDTVFLGVESGDDGILGGIEKRMSVEENAEAVRWAKEAGLFTHVNVILGLPGETGKTALKTVSAALRIDADACGFNILVPWPGSPVFEMAEKGLGGLRLLTSDWSQFGVVGGGALELEGLPRHELELLQLYGYARYYMRPSKFANLLRVGDLEAVPEVLSLMARRQAAGLLKRFGLGW
jgi:radical SAM superfamily enzyme YgiQ (UPF0313 family)